MKRFLNMFNKMTRRGSGANLNLFRFAAMVVVLLMLGIGNVWAGGSTTTDDDPSHVSNGCYVSVKGNTAEGLVYISNDNKANPQLSDYQLYSPIGTATAGDNVKSIEAVKCHIYAGKSNGPHKTYYWAMPVRGYKWKGWSGYRKNCCSSTYGQHPINDNPEATTYKSADSWKGVADLVYGSAGGSQCTYKRISAVFEKLVDREITYVRPTGGSYSVSYSYLKINSKDRTYSWKDDGTTSSKTYSDAEFEPVNVLYSVLTNDDRDKTETFYEGEKVTLTTSTANFDGWYANGAFLSSSKTYEYTVPATSEIQIEARFKSATIGTATGDLGPTLEAFSADGLESTDFTITVPVTTLGTWVASDFNVAFAEQTNPVRGDITKGTVTYSDGTLTIPFTYNPSSFGNTNVQVTVSPTAGAAYGNTVQFNILASANQITNYEACILVDNAFVTAGSLADMVAQANMMTNKPTVQLAKSVTINSPLSLQQSMTFDLNDKTITSTGASAFSIAAQGIDVQIVDNGYSQLGTIAVSSAQSGNVSVVAFTQKAKLTMQGGTLSATNTGSGSAYGINVTQGSTFYMTNGQLTVTGVSEAQGVHVATANDYATLNGGSITVTAPSNAYGIWSAGQSNVTDATIAAETTTGANAYGIYVNGGVSTLTTNTVTAIAKTANAYAAYVNAGRLNGNGGSFAAEAVTSGVYGVQVQAGAEAMLQMNAVVTAEATGASGTSVFGVNNLGTVSLTNVSVTATSPTTAATAVNTATSASAVSTTIDGGTYRATAAGGTAYGLHHQYGSLSIDGGTFRGVGDGNTVYGIRAIESATIANATITGETFSTGNSAYGISGEGAGKAITLTNCAITGRSNTSKAYAIYADANMDATNCILTATTLGGCEAYGLYAKSGTNSLNHCNATVAAQSIQAYGIYHKAGSLSIDGGEYEVTISQADAGESKMYGIYNESDITTEVQNAEFDVRTTSSYSQKVYGAYINGTLISSNSTYAVRAQTSVYGIYGTGASMLTLSGNTIGTTVSDGTISYGVYAKKNFSISGDEVRAVGNKTSVYALFFDKTNSVGTVTGGKFYAMGDGTTAFGSINGDATVGNVQLIDGVYSSKINLERYAATGYQVFNIDDTEADFAAGYRYILATSNPSPYVCKIVGGNRYATLEAALQYTRDNSGSNYTIVMTQDYTLPEGDYELPSNATLLIPYEEEQTTIAGSQPIYRLVAGTRAEYLRLTMAAGAHLNVNGKIEVGGEMFTTLSGQTSYINGPYGHIRMESGSLIQLNKDAYLYAWGYISGSGEITVKSGAEVHEMFQIGDMKSMPEMADGYTDYGDANQYKFFPLNRYYIQNIEVPTTYYYNARLITAMDIYYGAKHYGDIDIHLIGLKSDKALFAVTSSDENAWVRKSYDAVHDYQVWEVNSSVELGSLKLDLGTFHLLFDFPIRFNSAEYILPLTSNMKVHVIDGNFSITQDAQVLPGVQVEVNKTATLTINDGIKVYVFDKDQWPWTSQYTVVFSPGWANGTKPSRTVNDAALNIHGKIDVQGYLYTSNKGTETSKTDGANIYSTNADAGTIEYNKNVPSTQTTVTLMTSKTATKVVTMDPAKLKNGSGVTPAYTETSGTASGNSFIYFENQWQKAYTNGCFEVIGSTVYAKPSEYVALKKSQTDANSKLTGVAETNHTYLTAADKILILMDECQWWEVEATSDPTVFECKKTGYEGFYYYDNTTSKWKLKTVNVKFYSAETGDNVLKTIVTDYNGVPDQAVIATNPTKGTTAEYTYSFYGWKSSVTGTEYKWTDELEVATADMSYRPVFTKTKRNYTITLVNANNGANVPLEVPYGETPEYTPKKDATAQYTYSFNGWSPAFTIVTGTATYTAQWLSVVNNYDITWKNGETVLEVDENQPYGTVTSYGGATPTKAADDDYAYTFSGWHNSLTNAPKANNETVTGEITYTAQYNTTPRYAVTFNNYDGVQLDRIIYTQGETPAYEGMPTRKRDDNGYFRFKGWKDGNGTDYAANATLPAVTKKETYTAQYDYVTDLFTITLMNVDGNGAEWSCKFGEGSTPFYDSDGDDMPDTPEKTGNAQYSYPFVGWSQTSGGAKLNSLPAVDGEATYWALFTQTVNKYTVSIVANNDAWGSVSEASVPEVPYGTAITTSGNTLTVNGTTITATPAAEDAQYMYRFEGWEAVPSKVTGETEIQAVFKAYVATVEAGGNTTYHTTVNDAFTTANTLTNNPTVTMYKNASTASEIEITKTMTIDLNGKTITATQASATGAFKVNGSGKTVTICDNGSNGQINHTATYNGYMYGINVQNGSLSIESGTIYARNNAANRAYGIYTDNNASLVTVSGTGVVHAESSTFSFGIYTNNTCNLTMNGGTFTASGASCRGIYVKGTTTLTNATVTASGSSCYGIFAKSGALTIHSGTYTATGTSSVTIYYEAGTVTVEGGRFIGATKELTPKTSYGTNKVALKGGVYVHDADLTANCATNFYKFDLTEEEKDEVGSVYNYKVAEAYTVTFKDGDNKTIQSSPVEKNTTPVYSGTTPTKSQTAEYTYSFNGTWSPAISAVTAAAIYTAQFDNHPRSYTLTWDLNGGTVKTAGTANGLVAYGTSLTAPVVTKTGYTFADWTPTQPTTMPAANTTYTATWTPTNCNISYNLNGGSVTPTNANPTSYTIESNDITLINPTKEHYTFAGWTGSNGSTPQETVTIASGSTGNKSYTANWNPVNYNISYDLNGGSATNPMTYNIETATFALTNPTRDGYTFKGWTGSNGSTPEKTVTIAQGSTGDKSYTAQWVVNYTITWMDGSDVKLVQEWPEGSIPSYDYQKPQTAQYTYVLTGWSDENQTKYLFPATLPAVIRNATYTAQYNATVRSYTIQFVNDNNAVLQSSTLQYGATPMYDYNNNGTPVSSNEDSRITRTFIGWSPSIEDVVGSATYTAQYRSDITAADNTTATITISDSVKNVVTTTVETTGKLDIQSSGSLTTNTLILQATAGDGDAENATSGEITGAEYINTENTDVYYDLTLNTWARHWHAFGVPWKIGSLFDTKLVEIKDKQGNDCHNVLILGRDYDIIYYNGEKRAAQGPGRHCWDYVEDGDGTLTPGKAYMIGFIKPTGTVRFAKAADAAITTNSNQLDIPYYEGNGSSKDAGWNAIANPKTYHANMNAGVQFCHVHNADTMKSDGFTTVEMSTIKFVVGKAVYVQTANNQTTIVAISHANSAHAPRRSEARSNAPQYYAVHIMANGKSADRIYVKADEDKEENVYTNGIDVAKMGVSTVRAQMWIERYDTKLAVNTMAPVNNTAAYPLGISIPQAGEYEISSPAGENGDMLYLTYDGRIIWNLTYAPYSASFEKGTNTHYGLKLVRSNAPAVTTDMEQSAITDDQSQIMKVLIDDKVYILRGGEIYTITGQKAN